MDHGGDGFATFFTDDFKCRVDALLGAEVDFEEKFIGVHPSRGDDIEPDDRVFGGQPLCASAADPTAAPCDDDVRLHALHVSKFIFKGKSE